MNTENPCRRCKGTGVFAWRDKTTGREHNGACFLCRGTGNGDIRDPNGEGPRRPYSPRQSRKLHRKSAYKSYEQIEYSGPTTETAVIDEQTAPVECAVNNGRVAPIVEIPPLVVVAPPVAQSSSVDTAETAITAAIRAIAESVTPKAATVDENTVRAIVADEIAKITTMPRVLEIHVNGEPQFQLPATRHKLVETLLLVIASGVHAYIVGPSGSGKTTAAEQVAEALGCKFYMNGAMGGAHEITGYKDAYGAYHGTPFRQAFEHGGLYLADEIDGSDANAILTLNAALANGYMTFPDSPDPVKVHPEFRFIAAANTYGLGANRVYVGRNQLDGATLDRFAFLDWAYDESLESLLGAKNPVWVRRVQSVRKSVAKLNLRHIVSPRASLFGIKLLNAGLDIVTVEKMLVWRDMGDADKAKVEANI